MDKLLFLREHSGHIYHFGFGKRNINEMETFPINGKETNIILDKIYDYDFMKYKAKIEIFNRKIGMKFDESTMYEHISKFFPNEIKYKSGSMMPIDCVVNIRDISISKYSDDMQKKYDKFKCEYEKLFDRNFDNNEMFKRASAMMDVCDKLLVKIDHSKYNDKIDGNSIDHKHSYPTVLRNAKITKSFILSELDPNKHKNMLVKIIEKIRANSVVNFMFYDPEIGIDEFVFENNGNFYLSDGIFIGIDVVNEIFCGTSCVKIFFQPKKTCRTFHFYPYCDKNEINNNNLGYKIKIMKTKLNTSNMEFVRTMFDKYKFNTKSKVSKKIDINILPNTILQPYMINKCGIYSDYRIMGLTLKK